MSHGSVRVSELLGFEVKSTVCPSVADRDAVQTVWLNNLATPTEVLINQVSDEDSFLFLLQTPLGESSSESFTQSTP